MAHLSDPSISRCLASLGLSTLISILYPASLYLWPNALKSDRHHPSTIKRNFISVLVMSAASALALATFYQGPDDRDLIKNRSVLALINWKHYDSCWSFVSHCVLWPLLHVSVLFAGPIYLELQFFVRTYFRPDKDSKSNLLMAWNIIRHFVRYSLYDWAMIRNLLVAPFTEEFIFRGVLLALLTPVWSRGGSIAISSTLFGLMHSHHFLRHTIQTREFNRREALGAAFQCLYTSLFGTYASVVYLASGNLLTPILLHSFCNLNGLPNFAAIAAHRPHLYLTGAGFLAWAYYLVPLTRHALYDP